jgi:hypothetical protein
MKTFLLLVISLLSVSCVSLTERQIHDLNTNVVTKENKAFAMGGKFANRWGVGSVWNGEKSFRDVALATTAIATSGFSAASNAAEEVTARVATEQTQKTARNAAKTAAEVEIQKSADSTKVKLAELAVP